MAYDENAAERGRRALAKTPDVSEVKMMGALVFMKGGHMCCGVTGDAVMVRVGPDAHAGALSEPHVQPMEIGGGRRPRGFVRVAPAGYASDKALTAWTRRGLDFVASLPPKSATPRQGGKT